MLSYKKSAYIFLGGVADKHAARLAYLWYIIFGLAFCTIDRAFNNNKLCRCLNYNIHLSIFNPPIFADHGWIPGTFAEIGD